MVFGLAILSVFTKDWASGGHLTSVFTIKSLNRVEKRVWKHRNSKALVSRLSRVVLGPVNKASRGPESHWRNRREVRCGGGTP